MAKSRSSLLIAIGAAVFIVGSALTFLVAHHDKSTPQVRAAATVPTTVPGAVTAGNASAVPSFTIPAGKQALAISVPYVQAVAGYVKAGDKINIFGTIKPSSPVPKAFAGQPPGSVKLILSDIQVLSTSAPGQASATATGGNTTITFILALSPGEAEQVAYFQSWEGLYLSLARSDQGAISAAGHTAGNPF